MIGAVHAAIGACIGAFCKSKKSAYAAGVVSHIVADSLPHQDLSVKQEVPLLTGTMLAIAAWRGIDSPEFWGAAGGVSPDIEHGLAYLGITPQDKRIFPTHIFDGKYHGPESGERLSQVLIAAAAVGIVALAARKKGDG